MRIIIFVTIALAISLLESMAQEYPIRRYTYRNGLIQDQILALHKDRNGFLWIGTKYGVSRFDGERFENFENQKDLFGIHTNDIAEDTKGNIWFLQIERLVKFDGKKTWVYKSDSLKEISQFFIDNQDQVFVKQQNGGLWKLKNGRFHKSTASMALGDNRESYFYHRKTGKLFVSISSGLYLFKDGQLQLVNPDLKSTEFILESLDHTLYLYSLQPELQITELDPVSETTRLICKVKNQQIKIISSPKNDLIFYHQKQIWQLNHRNNDVTPIFEEVMVGKLILEDKGRFWVGTERGLVEVFSTGLRSFSSKIVPNAWSVVEDYQGNYWFGNYGHSLQKFDGKHITTEKRHHSLLKAALKKAGKPYSDDQLNLWYHTSITDRYGKIWFPFGQGIVVKENERFWVSLPELCFSAFEDRPRNRIVLPSCNGKIYMYENKPPYHYRVLNIPKKFQNGSCALTGIIAPNGDYWFTIAGGVYLMRYNSEREVMYFYTKKNKKLPSLGVTELCFDNKSRLWIGSAKGLWLRDERTDSFKSIAPNTFKSFISAILLLDNKHLLIGDDEGLRFFDYEAYLQKGQIKVKKLDENDGFMGGGAGQSGLYKDTKGKVWIMSGDYLSVLNPNQFDVNIVPLRPYFNTVNDSLVSSLAYLQAEVHLAKGVNAARIKLGAAGNDRTEKTLYSYKIDELDKDWSPWQSDNLIYKTNLESGHYTLRLRVMSEGQVSSGKQPNAVLRFEVDIPFWQSKYFPAIAGVSALFLLMFIIYLWLRNQQITKDQKMRFLQVRTIQAQMKPHFTSNILPAIGYLIKKGQTENAISALDKFGRLLRSTLDSSEINDPDKIAQQEFKFNLKDEIYMLSRYLDLEKLRHRFEYTIETNGIQTENRRMIPFLIQPFAENAVLHGFGPIKHQEGNKLWIRFSEKDRYLICEIEDNGIGRVKAQAIQKEGGFQRKSHGLKLISEQIAILKQIGNFDINFEIIDLPEESGTLVKLRIRNS